MDDYCCGPCLMDRCCYTACLPRCRSGNSAYKSGCCRSPPPRESAIVYCPVREKDVEHYHECCRPPSPPPRRCCYQCHYGDHHGYHQDHHCATRSHHRYENGNENGNGCCNGHGNGHGNGRGNGNGNGNGYYQRRQQSCREFSPVDYFRCQRDCSPPCLDCCEPPPDCCLPPEPPCYKPVKTKYVMPCYRYEDGRIERYVPTRHGCLPISVFKRNGVQDQIHGYRGAQRYLCVGQEKSGTCHINTIVEPLRKVYKRITDEVSPIKKKKKVC